MAEPRAQIAELTLEKAAYAGFASCTRRTARHVPYSVLHICSMPHVMQHAPATRHSAHQHLPCSPSTAVMPASIADWRRERNTHVPRSNEAEDNIHLSVPRAQRRCVASLGALSAPYSNLAAANSKPKAAQCGASDASLQDGSGSQCILMRTRACARAFLARVCECAA